MTNSTPQVFSFSEPQGKIYNVNYSTLDFGQAPFQGMLGQVDIGEKSHSHNHFEVEVFFFISGKGVVYADGKEIEVRQGLSVRVPPFINHVIENTSGSEPLKFVSFYWSQALSDLPAPTPHTAHRTLIFSAPPTPNGDIHLGHLSGPYLAADVYKRYLQQRGLSALHITGRDDHQTYVAKKASLEQRSPEHVANDYFNKIRKTLDKSGVYIDYLVEPNQNGDYAKFIKNIFTQLYEKGYIIAKTEMATFSAVDNLYLHEAYITGNCPHCQHSSDGNACEECGRPNACVDLLQAYEKYNKQAPVLKPIKRLYFRLSQFSGQLQEYIKSTPMSAHALALSQTMLAEGLPDICVSHINDRGIAVPLTDFEDQTIYVWFELGLAYLWGAIQANQYDQFDLEAVHQFYNNANNRVTHFYGFDNTYYHTLLFPAVYFALDIKPLHTHVINELLDLNGSKFSTSRGHAIWVNDLLNAVSTDYMRWFLCEIRPEGMRTNLELSHFAKTINQLFSGNLHNWTSLLTNMMNNQFNSIVPEPGAWTAEHQKFLRFILSCRENVLQHYSAETYSLRAVVHALKNIVETAHDFTNSQTYLNNNINVYNYMRTAIALSLFALKLFALLAKPIIPGIANQLLQSIGITEDTLLTDNTFIAPGIKFNKKALPSFQPINERDLLNLIRAAI